MFRHYDEAGLQVFDGYDFKGNVLSKYRLTIKDSLLQTHLTVRVDWTPAAGQTLANRETFYLELKAHRNATNTDGYRMDYSYDALNRIKSLVVPLDVAQLRKRLEPRYNKAGALEKVTLFPDHRVSTGAKDYIRHIAYNARGQEILMACGSTLMQRKVYDPLTFRLSRVRTERFTLSGNTFSFVTGTVRQDSTYTYDRAGNITQLRETSPNSGIAANPNELIRQYQYDALYRLLSAKGREWDNKNQNSPWGMPATANLVTVTANARLWERLYDYDLMGNLLRMRHVSSNSPNSFTRLYNPDVNNNMVTQFGANNRTTRLRTGTTNIDYLYDASGNMTRESGNRNLEYDYRQRTRLYFITNNTTLYEQYTYGADGHVVKRLNRSSGLIYSYVYIDGLFQYSDQIGHTSNAQNHINILDQSGAIISQHRQGTFAGEVAYTNGELYMINNHVGSVIGTYDLNGTQQEGEDYYPFGDSSHHWNGNKQQRFAGKIRLSWTGYYDFGARQYIPWLAKFTSVDPLAAKSTDRNPYHYASNNPINRTDPTGMSDGKGDGKGGGGKGETSNSSKSSSALSNEKTTGILFAGPNEEKAYNSFKREVLATVDTLQKTVDNLNSSLSEARSTGDGQKATSITKELEKVTGRLTEFSNVKDELTQLEASDEPFRIRMGKNMSNTSGGGNISFNKVTNEIDINISFEDKFNTNQKLSHELKHAFQFLQKELDLTIDGKGGGAYDLTDEERAFDRQNLFATRGDEFVNPRSYALEKYPNRPKNATKVDDIYSSIEQSQILQNAKYRGEMNFKSPVLPENTVFRGVVPNFRK